MFPLGAILVPPSKKNLSMQMQNYLCTKICSLVSLKKNRVSSGLSKPPEQSHFLNKDRNLWKFTRQSSYQNKISIKHSKDNKITSCHNY